LFQCSNSANWKPTYFEKRDENGRLIEKYGNENAPDNDVNFHSFYYYNATGQLVKERTYYFLDSTYIVKDTADYIDLIYTYDDDGNRKREIRLQPNYDSLGLIIGLDTTYVTDLKTSTTIYPGRDN
jgi:hypothetical protein